MSVPLRCLVPPSFVAVDLDVAPAERAHALLPPGANPRLGRQVEAFAVRLRASRARYAAIAVLPTGRPGYFAITEPAGAPPDLDTLAERLTGSGELREAELPCGRAIGVTEHASIRTGSGNQVLQVVQEHAWVRHPAGPLLAFTLGTADDRRRQEHLELFTDVLTTVRFS